MRVTVPQGSCSMSWGNNWRMETSQKTLWGCPFGAGQGSGERGRAFAPAGEAPLLWLQPWEGAACWIAGLPNHPESSALAWGSESLRPSCCSRPPQLWILGVSVPREGHQVLREKSKQIDHKTHLCFREFEWGDTLTDWCSPSPLQWTPCCPGRHVGLEDRPACRHVRLL